VVNFASYQHLEQFRVALDIIRVGDFTPIKAQELFLRIAKDSAGRLIDIEESLDSFDFPLYGRFAKEYHQMIVEGKPVDQHYFLNHENPQIAELTVNILSAPWEMSPNWEERFNNPLQNQPLPDLNFDSDARQALDRFKLRKLMKMCEINLVRIRAASEAGDMDTMMHYMRVQQKLNESRNELAARVGTVVLSK
jgi:DNA primase